MGNLVGLLAQSRSNVRPAGSGRARAGFSGTAADWGSDKESGSGVVTRLALISVIDAGSGNNWVREVGVGRQ